MRLLNVALLASTATAISMPDMSFARLFARKDGGGSGSGKGGSGGDSSGSGSGSGSGKCPAVWSSVSKELTNKFLTGGQCNPSARAAIRLTFHDCGAWNVSQGAHGGCDGSLALNTEENARGENKGLEQISKDMVALARKYNVGVADMIVFGGAHAIATCPGGPRVQTWIGRHDSTTAAPHGLLPDVNADPAVLSQLFKDKGFSDRDLAALLGAHSTSNQFNFKTDNGQAGLPQDSTPGIWDVKYYSETLNPPPGVVVFPSDSKLAQFGGVGQEFKGFINNQGKWTGKFADAMGKMALFGSSGTNGMVDCTDSLPRTTSIKREMKALNPFMPRE